MPGSRKGKRKATGNVSSSASSAEDVPDRGPSTKKTKKKSCRRSPVRVKEVAIAKASKSGSDSKGLASFESLINNSNLTAAREETNRGLKSTSSSKGSRGSSSTQSHADKPVFASFFYLHDQI